MIFIAFLVQMSLRGLYTGSRERFQSLSLYYYLYIIIYMLQSTLRLITLCMHACAARGIELIGVCVDTNMSCLSELDTFIMLTFMYELLMKQWLK